MKKKEEKKIEEIKTVTFDNIQLEIQTAKNEHIPSGAKTFIDHQNILKTIALGIQQKKHILILGESGVGKSSAIRYIAQLTNTPLRRVNLNGGTTADELVGRNGINEKGTYWIDGILTECMRKGYWLVLDEINASLAEVTFVLHSLLDDDGYIVLTEKPDKEIVRMHPNFRVFANANPSTYAGTKEMNTALLSRFHICIYADFPNEKIEKDIVQEHLGLTIANNAVTEKLIKIANDTRKEKELGHHNYCINTRDIINTLALCLEYNPKEAIKLAFSNKLVNKNKKAFELKSLLDLPDRKIKENEIAISKEKELEIGKKFTTMKALPMKGRIIKNAKEELESQTHTVGEIICAKAPQVIKKEETFIVKGYYYDGMKGEIHEHDATKSLRGLKIFFTEGKNAGSYATIALKNKEETKALLEGVLFIKED